MTRSEVDDLLQALQNHKELMRQYIQVKFEQEDWSSVASVANDLRALEAESKVYKLWLENFGE